MFEHLTPQTRSGYAWLSVDRAFLLRTLPFWSAEDLHRISRSLADKGVLLIDSAPLHTATQLVFALNEPAKPNAEPAPIEPAPLATTKPSATLLPAHWSPSEDLLQLLALNHNIPRQFALDQLEDYHLLLA